ncbi:hypothetical protein B0I35DRAFT_133673 [Stachybotrys elegans]|uniref:Uncharacterized protein n=1 Tax=Stachybotrys elegans TaxID=80388 RepID=A0A8K0SZY9_9HYPO|nr:hypothetical protein B0I35DRAFT_133673 [Stachybotrys elegans]
MNRTRILGILSSRGLPVDIRDDQYEYKVISDEHFDKDFGIYQCYKDGHLVPYPSRVPGTEMWQKARDSDAAVAAAAAAAPVKGKGRGRGANKRKAQEQLDGQPTPKKSTRGADDNQLIAPPVMAPAKGLLASAAEVDEPPEGTPADEDSVPASPEAASFGNGLFSSLQPKVNSKLSAREKSPPPPKNAADPDEYGFRVYNARPSLREKWVNSRLLAPHLFQFNEWEIGFRDSSNDSTKGHTRAKRGKCLDTPNSNGMHFDHWCNGYDASAAVPEDYDQDLVERYNIHPSFGIFMASSINDLEDPDPYVMPGKPIVYIANPSGRISHASRSYEKTVNHRRIVDAPWRAKIGASIRRFCKLAEIEPEAIQVADSLASDEELRDKSLGTALRELENRPSIQETEPDEEEQVVEEKEPETKEGGMSAMSVLTYATAFVEAQDATRVAPPTPKPVRYDAIRDVFTDSKPAPPPALDATSMPLSFLAELCSNYENRLHEPEPRYEAAPVPPAVESYPESDMRSAPLMDMRSAPVPEVHRMPMPDMHDTIVREEPPQAPPPYNPAPVSSIMNYGEPPRAFLQDPPRGPGSMQPAPPMYGGPTEMSPYQQPVHEIQMSQPPPMRGQDYNPHGPPPPHNGPMTHEQPMYAQHNTYSMVDPRESHMTNARPVDSGYEPRRMSGYSNDPGFGRPYWSQQQAPGPTHAPTVPPPPPQHYPPPATQSRIPFSHTASAEPLPPLRPPRARNLSIQEEPSIHDSGMRAAPHGGMSSYYSPGPPRPFHRAYPGPEQHVPQQQMSADRILPNPQPSVPSYMTSPRQSYPSQLPSPTFGNANSLSNPLMQSPPGTPHGGPPSSIHRHRSTPSGSSDAGSNKYRKLQPAPVPAHRAWSNKPELKTIPYDHKEGGAAALPSSGPTQIRGWNVNQHRKRSKADKNDRGDLMNERDDSR